MLRRFFDIASAQHAVAEHDDHSAFEFLFDAFYSKLLRVALYYLGKEMHAEDAISEVFFKNLAESKKASESQKY